MLGANCSWLDCTQSLELLKTLKNGMEAVKPEIEEDAKCGSHIDNPQQDYDERDLV